MAGAIDRALGDPQEAAAQLERAGAALDRFTPGRAGQAYLVLIDEWPAFRAPKLTNDHCSVSGERP